MKLKFSILIKDVESQRQVLHKRFGDYILRPYFKSHYRPLSLYKYEQKKTLEMSKEYIKSLLIDFFYFFAFAIAMFYLVLIATDSKLVYSYKDMEEMVRSGLFTRSTDLDSIEKDNDIYDYLLDTLILALHPIHWYGSWYVIDPGLTVDFNTRLLGVARLRQLRVKKDSCSVPKEMWFLDNSCDPDYTIFNDGGFDIVQNKSHGKIKTSDIWEKKTATETGSTPTMGK